MPPDRRRVYPKIFQRKNTVRTIRIAAGMALQSALEEPLAPSPQADIGCPIEKMSLAMIWRGAALLTRSLRQNALRIPLLGRERDDSSMPSFSRPEISGFGRNLAATATKRRPHPSRVHPHAAAPRTSPALHAAKQASAFCAATDASGSQ